MEKFGNENVFVLGIRRSGNHAIANWLFPQFNADLRYFNDHRFSTFGHLNSDAMLRRAYIIDKKEVTSTLDEKHIKYNLFGLENQSIKEFYDLHDTWKIRMEEALNSKQEFSGYILPNSHKDIVIIRNPWNNMASEVQWKYSRHVWNVAPHELILLWNEYYNNYLNQQASNIVFIIYDKWFINEDYRKDISVKLGLEFSDENLQKVHHTGNGSSFNKMRYDKNAQKMNVLKRYEEASIYPEMQEFTFSQNGKDLKDKWNHLCDLENIQNLQIK